MLRPRLITISSDVSREPEGESRPLFQFTDDSEIAAHRARESAADRESQPTPFMGPRRACVGLHERLKNRVELFLRDSTACVAHANADVSVAGKKRCSFRGRSESCIDGNLSAGIGALHSVREKVCDDLAYSLIIADVMGQRFRTGRNRQYQVPVPRIRFDEDRKSTRLNSSHLV